MEQPHAQPHPIDAVTCPRCQAAVGETGAYRQSRVCERCRYHFPMSARERIDLLVDDDTFQEVNRSLVSVDPLRFADKLPYKERLAEAQERTGLQEAVITGIGRIAGWQAVLAVSDFAFMGGSMGSVVGEKVALALELAARRRLPFIAVCSSGGARMQEGMLSLVQMAKTAAAAMRLHQAGVPMITVLTDPTTGGVYASYASQGDILLAEPGALIGFAGPRVIAQMTGQPPPQGTHTAEFLFQHGLVDQVVDRGRLRGVLASMLQLFHQPFQVTQREPEPYRSPSTPPDSAWEEVELARHADRPTARDYLARLAPQLVELHGDRVHGDDPALIAGLGALDGIAVVVIAQEKGRGEERQRRRGGQMTSEGYRKASRMMRLAAHLRLPILTLIDTPGAALDYEAEAHGLAGSISNCLATLSVVPVPVVAVIIGEGGSGGALALGVADRILMQENAIYSVIAPEGASAILYRGAERVREVASSLKLTTFDCQQLGVVDVVVPEPAGGAHNDPDYAALQLRNHLVAAFTELRKTPSRRLVDERYRKFRRMGQHHAYFREAVAEEVEGLRRTVTRAFTELRERLPIGHPSEGMEPEIAEPRA